MTRLRLGHVLSFVCFPLMTLSVPLHAQQRWCNGPNDKGCWYSKGSPGSSPSAQQTIDAINRNTAAQQKSLNAGFDALGKILRNVDSGAARGAGGDDDSDVETGSAPYISDRKDKYLPPDSVDLEDRAAERAARQRQREAADLLKDASKLQDCLAAMSTYNSGRQRELPAGCLSDIEQMSVYRSGAPSPAPQRGGFDVDTIIDGSDIPSVIAFPNAATAATERVFGDPPAQPASPQPTPSGSSDLDRAPDTPSTTLTPTYDSTMPPLPPPGTRPWNGGPVTTPETTSASLSTQSGSPSSNRSLINPETEAYAAGLFDDAREGKIQSFPDVGKSIANSWIDDQLGKAQDNTMSYATTGKSFDQLPETFKRDYSLWKSALDRISKPFSLKVGVEFVQKLDEVFDLWHGQ